MNETIPLLPYMPSWRGQGGFPVLLAFTLTSCLKTETPSFWNVVYGSYGEGEKCP